MRGFDSHPRLQHILLYKFRVIASKSGGAWNSADATVPFAIEPMWWQTMWARLGAVLAAGLVGFAFYRSRMLRMARQYSIRLDRIYTIRCCKAYSVHPCNSMVDSLP